MPVKGVGAAKELNSQMRLGRTAVSKGRASMCGPDGGGLDVCGHCPLHCTAPLFLSQASLTPPPAQGEGGEVRGVLLLAKLAHSCKEMCETFITLCALSADPRPNVLHEQVRLSASQAAA